MPTYAEILNIILENGSDNLGRFGGSHVGGYCVQQNPKELASLIQYLITNKPMIENYLEIGSASGGTTRTLWDFLKMKNVYIIDDNKHPRSAIRPELLKDVKPIECVEDSHSRACKRWLKDLSVKFDVIFFDGEHSYGGADQDFRMVKDKLNPGCILIFHDSAQPIHGISRFLEDLDEDKAFEYLAEYIDKEKPLGIAIYRYRG